MRFGPFVLERRSAGGADYTDAMLDRIERSATGVAVEVEDLGAVGIVASVWERALGTARVRGAPATSEALSAALPLIGRSLALSGEVLLLIDVSPAGEVQLLPCATWDVSGGPDWRSWVYRADVWGPSRFRSVRAGSESFVHVRVGCSARAPWRGRSPLVTAAARLGARVEAAVIAECRKLALQVVGGGGPNLDQRLRDLAGDTDEAVWKAGTAQVAEKPQWGQARHPVSAVQLGPHPHGSLPVLRSDVQKTLLAAGGLPVAFMEGGGREAVRFALHWTLQPLAAAVAAEASLKLGGRFRLALDQLHASDTAGRARAYGILVKNRVSPEAALVMSGLQEED